jgi:hypothetical protein
MLAFLAARIIDPTPFGVDVRTAVVSIVLLVALPGVVLAVCLSGRIRIYMNE